MPTVSQPKNLGDLLKYEAPNLYSRDQDTVAAAQNLSLGTVVGRETATAKLKALDPSARHAIVARGALIWPTGISTAHKVAAIKQLAERGVLARDSA